MQIFFYWFTIFFGSGERAQLRGDHGGGGDPGERRPESAVRGDPRRLEVQRVQQQRQQQERPQQREAELQPEVTEAVVLSEARAAELINIRVQGQVLLRAVRVLPGGRGGQHGARGARAGGARDRHLGGRGVVVRGGPPPAARLRARRLPQALLRHPAALSSFSFVISSFVL